MTPSDNDRLCNRVARLLLLASEARATGRHAVADQFAERAMELLNRIVSEQLAELAGPKQPRANASNAFFSRWPKRGFGPR